MSEKPKAKRGRPPKPINYEEVYKLAAMQCTDAEIAAWIDITEEGFRKRKKADPDLVGVLEKGRHKGKASLRRMQYQAAEKGNATMLIWLGKNLLAQTDKLEQKNDGALNVTVTHSRMANKQESDE